MSRLLINITKQQLHHHYLHYAAPFNQHHYQRCLITGRALATQANENKASLEQLTQLEQEFAAELPKFFNKSHNLTLYTKDIVFIDNTRNLKTQGINQYVLQLYMIKFYYNLRYTSIKVELLNLVKNPEESYLRIRWRVVTKPGLLKTFLLLHKLFNTESWRDGISTMHVNSDGKIYCHVCDNIDVNTDDIKEKQKSSVKNPLVDGGISVCNKSKV